MDLCQFNWTSNPSGRVYELASSTTELSHYQCPPHNYNYLITKSLVPRQSMSGEHTLTDASHSVDEHGYRFREIQTYLFWIDMLLTGINVYLFSAFKTDLSCGNPAKRYGPNSLRNSRIVPDKERYFEWERVFVHCDRGYAMNPKLQTGWSPGGLDPRVTSVLTCTQRNAWTRGEWFGLSTYALCVPAPSKS